MEGTADVAGGREWVTGVRSLLVTTVLDDVPAQPTNMPRTVTAATYLRTVLRYRPMLQLRRPTPDHRRKVLEAAQSAATGRRVSGRPVVREETIGWGIKRFDRARNALVRLEQFNLPGTVVVPAGTAAPGSRFVVFARRFGLWTAGPVEVSSMDVTDRSVSYTMCTLRGHPLTGEETFTITRQPNGIVRFRIEAISGPGTAWARSISPVIRLMQSRYRRAAIEHMRNATGVGRTSVTR